MYAIVPLSCTSNIFCVRVESVKAVLINVFREVVAIYRDEYASYNDYLSRSVVASDVDSDILFVYC